MKLWRHTKAQAAAPSLFLAISAAFAQSCSFPFTALGENAAALFREPAKVPNKIKAPYRSDARLAVLWVGHATALLQIDDKIILTDPVFTDTVGEVSKRLVEPGLEPENLPPVDVVLISHMHFDHLSLGTLEMIERKVKRAIVPRGGLVYVPNYTFDTLELSRWQTMAFGDLRITAVPVKHSGFRYGLDIEWMQTSFTGYIVEYHGIVVYFGGDTAYDRANFAQTVARFPAIDLALLPIAPIHPRDYMQRKHVDPEEALRAFVDLRARWMVPIHFDTFINSEDAKGEPPRVLRKAAAARGLGPDRVSILGFGEQRVFLRRDEKTR